MIVQISSLHTTLSWKISFKVGRLQISYTFIYTSEAFWITENIYKDVKITAEFLTIEIFKTRGFLLITEETKQSD